MDVAWCPLICFLVAVFVLWNDEVEASHSKLRIVVPQRINLIHHHRKTVHYAEDYGYGGNPGSKHHSSASCRKLAPWPRGKRHRRPHYRRSGPGYARGYDSWQAGLGARSDRGNTSGKPSEEVRGLRPLGFVPEPHDSPLEPASLKAPVRTSPLAEWDLRDVGRPPPGTPSKSPSGISSVSSVRNNVQSSAASLEFYPPLSPQFVPEVRDAAVKMKDNIPDNSGYIPRDANQFELGTDTAQDGVFGAREPKPEGTKPSAGEVATSFYNLADHRSQSPSENSRRGTRTRRRFRDQRPRPGDQPVRDGAQETDEQRHQAPTETSEQANHSADSSGSGDSTPTRKSKTDDVYYQAFRAFSYRTSRTTTTAPGSSR